MAAAVSVFDLFSVGIGPSSSHTVGPMRAAALFVSGLADDGLLDRAVRVKAELFGSLGATGHGHGSGPAVVLGLLGERPETVDTDHARTIVERIASSGRLRLDGSQDIAFSVRDDVVLHRRRSLPKHPNGMIFRAYGVDRVVLRERTYYSVGGGFVQSDDPTSGPVAELTDDDLPLPFRTGADLLSRCAESGLSISEVMRRNETIRRSELEIDDGLGEIWAVMQECVRNGCERDGTLPGGLRVRRRAPGLHAKLAAADARPDPFGLMDWGLFRKWSAGEGVIDRAGGVVSLR